MIKRVTGRELFGISVKENPRKHLPGYEALWFVIGGYQLAFGIFFVIYAYYKIDSRNAFTQYQDILSHELGLINTLILISSSWFAAAAIKLFRINVIGTAQYCLWAAVICGLVFSGIKYFEYQNTIEAGYTVLTNDFFTLYYLLTGLHLMHVWVGMCGLIIAYALLRKDSMTTDDVLTVESCIVFWHMVDFLWIIIFPLFYLIR